MLGVLVAHWRAGTPAGETAALESMWQEWQHHSFSQSSAARPSWGCGAEAGSLQAMGRLAGLEDCFLSSWFSLGFSPQNPVGQQGSREKTGLVPQRISRFRKKPRGLCAPSIWSRIPPWFCFPSHKYEHQRAGEGIFWSRQQNEENISLNPTLLQPPTCPTSEKRKVLCTEGKRFYFPSQWRSQQDVLQNYKYTFQTVNISISSMMPVG